MIAGVDALAITEPEAIGSCARALPGLWDAHAHLQDAVYDDRIAEVLQRAAQAGIKRIVVNGTSPADWDAVARLASVSPMILPAYGVHPLYVDGLGDGWESELEARLTRDPAAGVGEIGLDRSIAQRDDRLQERVFVSQIILAQRLRRSITIHCRRAWDVMVAALEAAGDFPGGLVFHSYGGGRELVPRLSRFNAWFSFSGTLTWPNNRRGPAAARLVAADRILVETDSPDLAPRRAAHGDPSAPNEPANLVAVVEALAAVRGGQPAAWAAITADNARRCFGIGRGDCAADG